MERRRNFVVRVEQSEALEELFRTKTDTFFYDKGSYTLHFTNPTTAKTIQLVWVILLIPVANFYHQSL